MAADVVKNVPNNNFGTTLIAVILMADHGGFYRRAMTTRQAYTMRDSKD